MLLDLLHWLDDPLRFRVTAWGLFALVAALALAPRLRPGWWRSPMLFGGAMLLALAAFRWPTILYNRTLGNPDESQLVAGAMTMAVDPVPFRSVDVHTAGPLTPLAIVAVAKIAGLPVDFVSARLLGLLCAWVLVLAQWRTTRAAWSEATSRALTLPLVAVLGAIDHPEVTELITEPVPAALLAGGLWAMAPLFGDARPSWLRLATVGLLFGAAPLAKLQSTPVGACLGFAALVLVWRQAGAWRAAWRPATALAAGSLIPLTALGGVMLAAGTLGEFFTSYIGANVGYVQAPHYPWIEGFGHVARMARELAPFHLLLWSALGAAVAALSVGWWFRPPAQRLLAVALALFAVALLAVLAPARAFPHYLVFLFGPAGLLSAVAVAGAIELAGSARFPWWPRVLQPVLWFGWTVGFGGLIVGQGISRVPGPIGRLGESDPDAARLQAVIRDYVRPGDTLSVWGWMPQYYPMTGLRQATREAHTQHQLTPGPRQESNRARYLGDLRSHPPAIFIDATGPGNWGFAVTVDFGYETFPALARWLGLHYRTVGLFNGGRILARRDRVFAADPSAAEIVGAFPAAAPAPAGWRGTKPYALGPVEAATTMAHAPCTVFWDPFASAQLAQFRYGILPGGFTGEGTTDGVVFRILALNHERGAETVLFERYLRPLGAVEDRSEQVAEIRVPAGMSVAFETDPGPLGSSAFDWAYWRGVRFESIRH